MVSAYVVNDFGGLPNLGVGGRNDNSLHLSLGDVLGLNELEGLRRSCGIGFRQSVDVGESLDLGGGEGMLEGLGPVDNLSRNPHAGRGHDLKRGVDLGLSHALDLQLSLGDVSEHRSWDMHCDGLSGIGLLGLREDSDFKARTS